MAPVRTALLVSAVSAALAVAGCTGTRPGGSSTTGSSSATTTVGTAAAQPPAVQPPAAGPPASGPGVSPNGVTTSVNAPASSQEEEYYQACKAALDWLADKQGAKEQLAEQYLAYVQKQQDGQPNGPGTFHKTWQALPPDQQAAVIVAANAAAAHQCG